MLVKNDLERVITVPISAATAVVAGAGSDNVKITGQAIDKTGFDSALISIVGLTSIAINKTLSYAIEIQESADNSTWATAEVLQASAVAATATAAIVAKVLVSELSVNISKYSKYIRFNITADLSNTATDTLNYSAIAILANDSDLVQPRSLTARGVAI